MSGFARQIRRTRARRAYRALERAGFMTWLAARDLTWQKLTGEQREALIDAWLAAQGLDRIDLGSGIVLRRGRAGAR